MGLGWMDLGRFFFFFFQKQKRVFSPFRFVAFNLLQFALYARYYEICPCILTSVVMNSFLLIKLNTGHFGGENEFKIYSIKSLYLVKEEENENDPITCVRKILGKGGE